MDVDTAKLCCTLSERRGLGLMTLDQRYSESAGWERKDEGATGEATGPASGSAIRSGTGAMTGTSSSGGQGIRQSVLQKVSYFRWRQLQDGVGIGDHGGAVTVEEISRDCPASSHSPGSSPSSKNRASLPGLSPRWPHTYHHESIFNFPSLSSSFSRRRPSAEVALGPSRIGGANSSRSRYLRLPTVVEKPTTAATECETPTSASCGAFGQPFAHNSLPVDRRADVGSADGLSSRPSQTPRVLSCVCNSTADVCCCALSASEFQGSTGLDIHHVQAHAEGEECRDRSRPVSPGLPRAWRTAAANWQCPYSNSQTGAASSSSCFLGFPAEPAASDDATSPSDFSLCEDVLPAVAASTSLNPTNLGAGSEDHHRCYSNWCVLKNRTAPQDHFGTAGDDHHRDDGSSDCPTFAGCYVLTDTPHPSSSSGSRARSEDSGAQSADSFAVVQPRQSVWLLPSELGNSSRASAPPPADSEPSGVIHECTVSERRAESTAEACHTCYQCDWGGGQVTQSVSCLENCEAVVLMNRDADVSSTDPSARGLMELQAEDKKRPPLAPPSETGTTTSRQCLDDTKDGVLVDGPVVAAPPITLVFAAPRATVSGQSFAASCRHHEAANKMGNCSSCHRSVAWNTQQSWASRDSQPLASRNVGVPGVSQPSCSPLTSAVPSVSGCGGGAKRNLVHQMSESGALPLRHNCSRSDGDPAGRNAMSSDGRDRRTLSVDRPLSAPEPEMSVTSPKTGTAHKGSKVDILRELTERLRPPSSSWSSSSSSTPSPSVNAAVESNASSQMVAIESNSAMSVPVQSAPVAASQLPPIPVAPPRQPRGRLDRKKSVRVKKDSATSTVDLVTSPQVRSTASAQATATETSTAATETATEKASENGDIVLKKTCLASSAEVTRQPSLFLPPPTNDDQRERQLGQERGRDGLFSANPLVSTPSAPATSSGEGEVAASAPSEDADLFEDVQLTVSKLNPKILVGTYQQRTIPFRSASFSQIDVGADGTYNRRPRTPITLRPITYSIGKESNSPTPSPSPLQPLSATLPRRKMSERQESKTPVHGSVSPCLFHLDPADDDVQENPTPVLAPRDEGNREGDHAAPVRPERHGHAAESSKRQSADVEGPNKSCLASPIQDDLSESPLISPEPKYEWVGLVRSNLREVGKLSRPGSSESETETTGTTIIKKETVACSEPIDMSDYESTEISVRADIRLLGPSCDQDDEAEPLSPDANTTTRRMTIHESKSSLDLVELNNRFLHLTESGRDSPSKSESGIIIKQESSDHSDGDAPSKCGTAERSSPTWITQLFRIANGQRESNSSLSDEGCVTDPADYSHPEISKKVPFSSAAEHPSFSQQVTSEPPNDGEREPSPPSPPPRPLERMNSKRRRRSSALTSATSPPAVDLTSKGNPRPLSHPLQSPSLLKSPTVEDDSAGEVAINKSGPLFAKDSAECSLARSQELDETISSCDTLVEALDSAPDHVYTSTGGNSSKARSSPDQMDHQCAEPRVPSQVTSIRVENTDTADSQVTEAAVETSAEVEEQPTDESSASVTSAAGNTRSRAMVSLSLTLSSSPFISRPSVKSPSHSPRNASPQPPASIQEVQEGCTFSAGSERSPQPKSPQAPRRYGTLKRRPLRGPYGEMLEAEMNKSEISKMYHTKRSEDLSFLREPCPRNRDVKSSSPRPHSPAGLGSITDECIRPATSAKECNARQNSLPLPLSSCHSMDDSRLKVGYNTLPLSMNNSSSSSGGSNASSRLLSAKRKISANLPYVFSEGDLGGQRVEKNVRDEAATDKSDATGSKNTTLVHSKATSPISSVGPHVTTHQRTSSSPCQLMFTEGGFTSEDEPELLELTSLSSLSRSTAKLLEPEGDSVNTAPTGADRNNRGTVVRSGSIKRHRDTRTHAVGELYDTERSYVESLQILVTKYLQPLKSPECAGLVEAPLVDEIFYQIPTILAHHELFLEELRKRLESWDSKQCVGGVFLDALTKPPVIDTYTAYINHWKHAKEAVKTACQAKSAFAKFLGAMAREHKGKLALDSLLIMPVQRIPRYELIIKMLLKHTPRDHPDHSLLLEAQKQVHDLAVKINCVERETLGAEQQQATLRELESLVEGLGPGNLASPERTFHRHDVVTIPSALGTRKERALFLFSDLLVITSVKRRSAAIRKSSYSSSGIASTLEANKFKLLMRVPLEDLEVTKGKEESSKRSTKDLEHLEEDLATLNQLVELVSSLHVSHAALDEAIKEIQTSIQRQLSEKQSALEPHLSSIDLAISTQDGTETLSVAFTSAEKRLSWEEAFTEAKLKLRALSPDRRPPPEFLSPLPIRKTRAGLQFTCAAPTVSWNSQYLRDVWVCNSDGYVGQVCILSLHPEPNVASCNGVCNARITCIVAVPSAPSMSAESEFSFIGSLPKNDGSKMDSQDGGTVNDLTTSCTTNFELESSESSDDSSADGDDSADETDSALCPGGGLSFSQRTPTRASSIPTEVAVQSGSDELEATTQATMWLGTEDGCIHIYHCGENIRLKKNRIRIQQGAAVLCLLYLENRVFATLANGDIVVYYRDPSGVWNINEPQCITIGSVLAPVTRMLPVNNRLWCSSQNTVKILDVSSMCIEDQFAVSSDSQRAVLSMASNGLGVWVAMQGSAVVRLFHAVTHECICDVNLAPAVNKMLAGCDDIIRQHKAACLRVTSMLVCRDLLWVGTSAGVLLTVPTPHLTAASSRLSSPPPVTGISHGHTGHVRFLTCVEATPEGPTLRSSRHPTSSHRYAQKGSKESGGNVLSSTGPNAMSMSLGLSHGTRMLVISGGDGYEDFRHTAFSDGSSVGREDSTNHLLLWQV